MNEKFDKIREIISEKIKECDHVSKTISEKSYGAFDEESDKIIKKKTTFDKVQLAYSICIAIIVVLFIVLALSKGEVSVIRFVCLCIAFLIIIFINYKTSELYSEYQRRYTNMIDKTYETKKDCIEFIYDIVKSYEDILSKLKHIEKENFVIKDRFSRLENAMACDEYYIINSRISMEKGIISYLTEDNFTSKKEEAKVYRFSEAFKICENEDFYMKAKY